MSEELISVIDAAKQIGKAKQSVFKVLKRLGIETHKLHGPDARGQLISYITMEDFRLVTEEMKSSSEFISENLESVTPELGVFYLVQLEPDHDSGRFTLGFASSARTAPIFFATPPVIITGSTTPTRLARAETRDATDS